MKKIILLCVVMLSLVGCSKSRYTEISYKQLIDKIDNKETFVIVFGSDTCEHCRSYEKTMNKVIKDKKIKIYYLNVRKLSDEDYAKVYSKFVVTATPTTAFLKNGVEESTYNRIVGEANYDKIVEKLKLYGYIGE